MRYFVLEKVVFFVREGGMRAGEIEPCDETFEFSSSSSDVYL